MHTRSNCVVWRHSSHSPTPDAHRRHLTMVGGVARVHRCGGRQGVCGWVPQQRVSVHGGVAGVGDVQRTIVWVRVWGWRGTGQHVRLTASSWSRADLNLAVQLIERNTTALKHNILLAIDETQTISVIFCRRGRHLKIETHSYYLQANLDHKSRNSDRWHCLLFIHTVDAN